MRSFHTFLLTLTFGGLDTDFLVVLLESGEVLAGLQVRGTGYG